MRCAAAHDRFVAVAAGVGGVDKGRGRLQRSGTQRVRQEHRRSFVETRTRTTALYRNLTLISTRHF